MVTGMPASKKPIDGPAGMLPPLVLGMTRQHLVQSACQLGEGIRRRIPRKSLETQGMCPKRNASESPPWADVSTEQDMGKNFPQLSPYRGYP